MDMGKAGKTYTHCDFIKEDGKGDTIEMLQYLIVIKRADFDQFSKSDCDLFHGTCSWLTRVAVERTENKFLFLC